MQSPNATIAAAVEAGRRQLLGVSPTPGLDARVLAGHALGMDASALIAYGENLIDNAKRKQLAGLIDRRKAGEPVAYIVGSKEFCRLRLAVDRRVLVPRPETEELVDRIVKEWHGRAIDALDLGTGSGAIACALADAMPKAQVLATDISRDALEVAAQNVASFALSDQVELAAGDLFDAVDPTRQFDIIAANLPYIATADVAALEPAVREYEPAVALFGGTDGLNVYRKMLPDAPARLKSGGCLYMECAPGNARVLAQIAADLFRAATIEVVRDLAGLERIVAVRTGDGVP
jgi:release factor glutamine methyltransferase